MEDVGIDVYFVVIFVVTAGVTAVLFCSVCLSAGFFAQFICSILFSLWRAT